MKNALITITLLAIYTAGVLTPKLFEMGYQRAIAYGHEKYMAQHAQANLVTPPEPGHVYVSVAMPPPLPGANLCDDGKGVCDATQHGE